jgi:FdrA protein
MSGVVVNIVRQGFYLDSVALMRFSREVSTMEGVEEVALMMGTPSNREIMAEADVLGPEGEKATGGDLVIGIRAKGRTVADEAITEAERLLDQSGSARGEDEAWRPRTIRAAVRAVPETSLALISVPGEFAAAEARQALNNGLHVMMFSDNVPMAQEVELKLEARRLGRLLMGPDCGTAIINGVPLGFANEVVRGDIGIVGASGTGMQEISCLISREGGGISQAIGAGGRDLKEEVGGITTLMAIDVLDADPDTRHIVLVSKPPASSVAAKIIDRIKESTKTFTVCFLGASGLELPKNARLATTLKEAAESALGGKSVSGDFNAAREAVVPSGGRKGVTGLFSGGTLCVEAQHVFCDAGQQVCSNVAIPGAGDLGQGQFSHCFIDLGDDEHTRGRPHPMIDPAVRDEALTEALIDPDVAVIIVDIILGFGAHHDPAGHFVESISRRGEDGPVIIASVTGTDADEPSRFSQVNRLKEAGVFVSPSSADAALLALACINRG